MDTLKTCKQCRQPLPLNAPEGLCPACLAKAGLETKPAAPGPTVKVNPPAEAAPGIGSSLIGIERYFGDYELLEEIAWASSGKRGSRASTERSHQNDSGRKARGRVSP